MSEDLMAALDAVDLSTVETSFPILKSGLATCTVTECSMQKDDGAKWPYLLVKLALAQEWETQPLDNTPSKPVNIGFPITDRIYIGTYEDKKDGSTKPFGIDKVARLRESAFGKAAPGTKFNPTEMVNQTVLAKLKFDPTPKNKNTGETYGPQTVVDSYVKKKS